VAVEYRYVRSLDGGSWLDAYLSPVTYYGLANAERGQEIDAWASWRPWPVLDLVGGYSLLVLSDDAREALSPPVKGLPGVQPPPPISPYTASLSHFAYLQATLRVP
jgi:hypothetical protein